MVVYPLEENWVEEGGEWIHQWWGSNTVDNVTNVIGRFLLLVKSGLPNFVSFPFVFYKLFLLQKEINSNSNINIYKHRNVDTMVCVANITHARNNKRKQQPIK